MGERVCMYRHEEISAGGTRDVAALPQRNEVIALAHQHRPVARLLVHASREFAGDGQHHVLLADATGSERPGIVAAMTGVDAVAHAVESFVSTAATPASRMLAREAWRLLAANLPRVLADDGGLEARAAVQLGAAWAGLAIENSMLGAAHALANPLTAAHGTVHGQAVGLVLPHVVRFNAPAVDLAYGELLRAGGRIAHQGTAAAALAAWLEELLAAAGLGRSLSGIGITLPDIPALAAAAATQWTAGFNPQPVTAADLAAIYEAAR